MSIERSVKRAERRKELDRETWADLDKVDYHITAEGRGEAIAGPFWFGAAFDAPPFFTFSAVANNYDVTAAPQFTVGVAEWLQDEQDMYVGAMLWFAWDACWEEFRGGLVYSENFESILSRQGGGPWGNEIPSNNSTGGYEIGWPSLNQDLPGQALIAPLEVWATRTTEDDGRTFVDLKKRGVLTPYTTIQGTQIVDVESEFHVPGTNWYVSTANPRPNTGGQTHLRRDHDGFSESITDRPPMPPVLVGNTLPCVIPDNETFNEDPERPFPWDFRSITILPFFAAREGMIITVEFDAMVSTRYGNDQAFVEIDFFGEDAHYIGQEIRPADDSGTNVLEEHWQTFKQVLPIIDWGGTDPDTETQWPQYHNEVPSTQDIRYISVGVNCAYDALPGNLPYPAKTWDIDNIKVTITGEIPVRQTPNFLVALNFSGQILKGYASIHPLRSYEHPVKVVLS